MSRVGRAVALLLACALAAACQVSGSGPADPTRRIVALVGGRVQPAPDAPAIANGVVLVEGGVITAVGPSGGVRIPPGAVVLDCAGATVSAGFWNSHVHFTGAVWQRAEAAPAEQLATGLRAMLTSYGVVRVVDTGSFLPNTLALRRRIESGEIPGPSILTAGTGFVPPGGSPYYLLPARLPEPASAEQATAMVEAELERGADGVKLFTGSFARRDSIIVMPVPIVRAAVEAAHRRGKFVIAHPSNSAGARAALDGGVDILAHTFPTELDGPWDRALPARMRAARMALIPTLKLWPYELRKAALPPPIIARVLANGRDQLRAFAEAGGQVLFGTDVGYMTEYDPTDEYVYMEAAGLSYAQILASLTTAPAERFGVAAKTGRVARGMDADLTVVDGEPERDIRALARVRYTLRAGRVVYERKP